ncbi:arsenate reductase (glutaredoxin) [Sulfurimonas sp. MAG313]|nr:arsenate reductase (glutaredoxin) [Sulfurimonas sp. MAG313]MDF1881188.1 arsenate reductase (glutaredoxin) [Sulfurimonas sp. MAG313]
MSNYQIWHNPRCSKSRQALAILEEKGREVEVVKYMDTLKSINEIKEVLKKLNISARELMRTTEDEYKSLNLKEESSEDKLIEAMSIHPKLIQRAIVIKGDKAVLARPPEKVLELI